MKIRVIGTASVMVAVLASCGTVTRGKTEDVTIKSVPEDASIRTSIGQYCPRSPCTFSVARKTAFTAFAEKPGYKTGSVEITTKVQGGGAAGYAGNVILGGVIGIGVDAATGANLDHTPNPATIVLEPVGKPSASPKKPKAGRSPKTTPIS